MQAKEGYEMQDEEKVDEAGQRKDKGNELFKQSKFGRASKKYKKAIDLIDYDSKFEGELKVRSRDIKKGANLNLAACYLRLKQHKEARAACDKVTLLSSCGTEPRASVSGRFQMSLSDIAFLQPANLGGTMHGVGR